MLLETLKGLTLFVENELKLHVEESLNETQTLKLMETSVAQLISPGKSMKPGYKTIYLHKIIYGS